MSDRPPETRSTTTARQRLQADLARYYAYIEGPANARARLRTILRMEGIWAIAMFRFGQYLDEEAPAPVRALLRPPFKIAYKLQQQMIGIHLSVPARIGPGLYVGHYGGIWVSPEAELGANCTIAHQVTIGVAGRGRSPGRRTPGPVLGDRVWVGPNSTITGPVRVGSGAVIAANSLVASNLPENAVAVGVPARVISYQGSAHLLNLPVSGGKETTSSGPATAERP